MLFTRVKPLEQILETAERKSLKRQLGPVQLTLLGIGAIIGTGIFVLTAEAGQKAGPAMMIAFIIAAVVCALAALGVCLVAIAGSRPGFRLDTYPNEALAVLDERGELRDPDHHLMAPEFVGNLLEVRYGREAHVFIDDRVDMYPLEVSLDYGEMLRPGSAWQEVLDRYAIDTVLWKRDTPLGALVASSPAWS